MSEIAERLHSRVKNAVYGLWRELEAEGQDMSAIPTTHLDVLWDGSQLQVVDEDEALTWEKVYEEPAPEPEPEPEPPPEEPTPEVPSGDELAPEDGGFADGGVVLG